MTKIDLGRKTVPKYSGTKMAESYLSLVHSSRESVDQQVMDYIRTAMRTPINESFISTVADNINDRLYTSGG